MRNLVISYLKKVTSPKEKVCRCAPLAPSSKDNTLSNHPYNLKLNGYRVTGKLTFGSFSTEVRAVLDIPESGPLREVFLSYIEEQDAAAPMTLEWSIRAEEGKLPFHYKLPGKILNTQFPRTRLAIFQSEGY